MAYGTLTVNVVEAQKLPSKDWTSKNDPYCKLELKGSTQKVQTKTISGGGKSARWEEQFNFNIIDGNSQIFLQVMDKDTFSADDVIGSAAVDISNLFQTGGQPVDRWVHLKDSKGRDAGEVRLVFIWKSSTPQQQGGMPSAAANPMNKYSNPLHGGPPPNPYAPPPNPYGGPPPPQQYAPPPPAPPPAASGLPPGWEAHRDASGRTYYVNSATRQTQWDPPTAPPPPPPPPAAAPALPPGWQEHRDASGKPYYVNTATNQTQWEPPTAASPPPAPAPPGMAPLPPGWTEERDASGKVYYANHQMRTTQWDRPY